MKLRATFLLFAAFCFLATSPAWAQGVCYNVPGNLILNCGFELTDYTDWTSTGATPYAVEFTGTAGWPSNSGNYFSYEGGVGSDHFLSQTFSDSIGQGLTIQFWYGSDGGTPNDLNVWWNGGIPIYSLFDEASTKPGYNLYSFNVTATGLDTLMIGIRNDPSFQALDDVSVAPTTPEPGTMILFGSGVLGLAGVVRRKLSL